MPVIGPSGYPQTSGNRTRAQVRSEIADYSGGGNKPDIQAKADRAWETAVREFNSVAWTFNRVVADIPLDTTLMLANITAPSLSRDAGAGVGFTLQTGKKILYWVEERVRKDGRITKRSNSSAATTVTLTGDGTVEKPVLTRPAVVNTDATHWALYGTGIDNAWPDGAEVGEAVIATTTIEDLRTGMNPIIPLLADADGKTGNIYRAGVYDVPTNVRNPVRAHLVDLQGRERIVVTFVPYRQYAFVFLTRVGTGSRPLFYTFRNRFRQGQLICHPRPQDVTLWPIFRFVYDMPIALPGSDAEEVLQVPQEVDEAIFQRTTVIFLSRLKGTGATVGMPAFSKDFDLRLQLEQEYRDFEDT